MPDECSESTGCSFREEENEMATENAIAALGRVLENHGTALEESAAAQSWNVWVNSLPLVEDKIEARYVHAQLVRHVEASDQRCDSSSLVSSLWTVLEALMHVPRPADNGFEVLTRSIMYVLSMARESFKSATKILLRDVTALGCISVGFDTTHMWSSIPTRSDSCSPRIIELPSVAVDRLIWSPHGSFK